MNRTRDLALLALYCALLFLWRLGARDFWEPAEGRCAQVAREMLRSGDFVVPRINGVPYLEKPPLFHWLVAASFWVTGREDEFTARLPAALAGVACVIATFELGRRTAGRAAGWFAAVTLALSAKFLWQTRSAEVDVLLALWVVLAYDAIERAQHDRRFRPAIQLGTALGLSVLTKGLVAPIIVVLPVVVLALAARLAVKLVQTAAPAVGPLWELSAAGRLRFGWKRGFLAACLTLVIGLSWYAAVVGREPTAWQHFWQAGTFQTVDHRQPTWYYAAVFPAAVLPGGLALPWLFTGLLRAESARPQKAGVLAAAWLIVPLILFSVHPSKQSHYLVPMIPAFSILLGQTLVEVTRSGQAEPSRFARLTSPLASWPSHFADGRGVGALAAAGLPLTALVGAVYAASLRRSDWAGAGLAFAFVIALVNWLAVPRKSPGLCSWIWTACQWTVAWLLVFGFLVPDLSPRYSRKPFFNAVRSRLGHDTPLAGFFLTAEQLFYLDRPVRLVQSSSDLPVLYAAGTRYVVVPLERYEIYRQRFKLTPVLRASLSGAQLRDRKDDLLLVRLEAEPAVPLRRVPVAD